MSKHYQGLLQSEELNDQILIFLLLLPTLMCSTLQSNRTSCISHMYPMTHHFSDLIQAVLSAWNALYAYFYTPYPSFKAAFKAIMMEDKNYWVPTMCQALY